MLTERYKVGYQSAIDQLGRRKRLRTRFGNADLGPCTRARLYLSSSSHAEIVE
jgi:hypothetical protein